MFFCEAVNFPVVDFLESKMIQIKSVLIADDIEKECVEILNAAGVAVTVKTKQTKEELMNELPKHDAVVVRSATKVGLDLEF